MSRHFAELAYTPAVRAAQIQYIGQAAPTPAGPAEARLGQREIDFIRARNSFYLATVGETGCPHVQHRGGPTGFLRVIDEQTLAFADYAGNRQMISVGNLTSHPQSALILLDYPERRRLKLLVRGQVIRRENCPEALLSAVLQREAPAAARIIRLELAAYDWNCPRFITPRMAPSA